MRQFVKRKILDESVAMDTLLTLYAKLAGNYADNKNDSELRDKEDRL